MTEPLDVLNTISSTDDSISNVTPAETNAGVFLWLKSPQCEPEHQQLRCRAEDLIYVTSDPGGNHIMSPQNLADEYGLSVEYGFGPSMRNLDSYELDNVLLGLHEACDFDPSSMQMAQHCGYDEVQLFPPGMFFALVSNAMEVTELSLGYCSRRVDLCPTTSSFSNPQFTAIGSNEFKSIHSTNLCFTFPSRYKILRGAWVHLDV
jgi:hypothetical protein